MAATEFKSLGDLRGVKFQRLVWAVSLQPLVVLAVRCAALKLWQLMRARPQGSDTAETLAHNAIRCASE